VSAGSAWLGSAVVSKLQVVITLASLQSGSLVCRRQRPVRDL